MVTDIGTVTMCIWGAIKTGKTTFGLTFPKPIVYLDLDQSFERAEWRFAGLDVRKVSTIDAATLAEGDVIKKAYLPVIKWPGANIADGYINAWENYCQDFKTICENPRIRTIQVDTGTMAWRMAHQAQLERVQRHTPAKSRQNLLPVEYARPNSDMRAIYAGARAMGKNLILVHQVGGIYEDKLTPKGVEQVRVGDTWDGWRELGAFVDVVVRANWKDRTEEPSIRIEVCGLIPAAEGITMVAPTFELVLGLINGMRGNGR